MSTKVVSIPYRHSKNYGVLVKIVNLGKMFQFLIGTLKTNKLFNIIFTNQIKFQFLIGTLKTNPDQYDRHANNCFNSL